MITKSLFPIFSALAVASEAFFYSPPSSSATSGEDCAWLPWQYMACEKRGGEYRKLENRKKISLHGGANCGSQTESRTTQKCDSSEFIASTVLSTIKNRVSQDRQGVAFAAAAFAPSAVLTNPAFHAPSFKVTGSIQAGLSRPASLAPSLAHVSLARPSKVCGNTFVDKVSGVKMLGAECKSRKTRNVDTPETARSRTKRQFGGDIYSVKHRDILFLLDESGSVGQSNFRKELEFVKVILQKLSFPREISQDATRIAVTTFATNHKHHIDLPDFESFGDIKNALRKVKYRGGLTCMIETLKAARKEVFTSAGGSRVPGDADGLIILVTDGCFNCHGGDLKSELQTEQKLLEKNGVSIVTFMVNVGNKCETSLTALQDGSSCFRGFSYPSWAKFKDLIEDLRTMDGVINSWTKESPACP